MLYEKIVVVITLLSLSGARAEELENNAAPVQQLQAHDPFHEMLSMFDEFYGKMKRVMSRTYDRLEQPHETGSSVKTESTNPSFSIAENKDASAVVITLKNVNPGEQGFKALFDKSRNNLTIATHNGTLHVTTTSHSHNPRLSVSFNHEVRSENKNDQSAYVQQYRGASQVMTYTPYQLQLDKRTIEYSSGTHTLLVTIPYVAKPSPAQMTEVPVVIDANESLAK
ncbi:hypothetical protein KG892_03435 [Vermiphilus pyriformis]|nr:MAG: hypothetical protein KG892_03435 [Vermiphilus pyriformis]